MPQFDKLSFFNQSFLLLTIATFIFIKILKFFLPVISFISLNRQIVSSLTTTPADSKNLFKKN